MNDILEHLEAAGEAAMERATEGVPEGMWRCSCGKVTTMQDAHPVSANPYSMPICGECLERADIESRLNRMKHLGFTDWAFKRGAFFSEVQARGEGIFNVLAIESARMIVEHGVLLAARAAFENEVAIDNEIISRLTAQVFELGKEIEEAFEDNCGGCMRGDEVFRDSDAGWHHLPIGIVCLSQQLRERAYQRKKRAMPNIQPVCGSCTQARGDVVRHSKPCEESIYVVRHSEPCEESVYSIRLVRVQTGLANLQEDLRACVTEARATHREAQAAVLIEVLANIQQESRAVREVSPKRAREGTEAKADPPRFSEPIDGEFSPAEGHECSGERCSDH